MQDEAKTSEQPEPETKEGAYRLAVVYQCATCNETIAVTDPGMCRAAATGARIKARHDKCGEWMSLYAISGPIAVGVQPMNRHDRRGYEKKTKGGLYVP